MDLFLSMRLVACIRLCESSAHYRKGKYLFHIYKIACKNFDRRNGETPDKIGGFLGNIFFIAL